MAASLMNFEKESHEGKHWAKLAPHSFNQRMAAPSRTIRSAKRRDLRKNHSIRWADAVKLVVQLGHVIDYLQTSGFTEQCSWKVGVSLFFQKGQTIASIKPTTTNLDTIQQKKISHTRLFSFALYTLWESGAKSSLLPPPAWPRSSNGCWVRAPETEWQAALHMNSWVLCALHEVLSNSKSWHLEHACLRCAERALRNGQRSRSGAGKSAKLANARHATVTATKLAVPHTFH